MVRLTRHQAMFAYTAHLKATDALTCLLAWWLTWVLRFNSELFPSPKGIPRFQDYSQAALPLVLVFSAVFHLVGAYRRERIHFGFRSARKIVQGNILAVLVFVSLCYFMYQVHLSRVFLTVFLVLSTVLLFIGRISLDALWRATRDHLIQPTRILLMGGGELLDMYVNRLRTRRPYPIDWVGQLCAPGFSTPGVHRLGDERHLATVLHDKELDCVVVHQSTDQPGTTNPILAELSQAMVDVRVIPDFGQYSTFTYSAQDDCGIPILVFNEIPVGSSDRVLKRAFDFLGAALLLVLFSPLFLIIAAVIRLTSRGPIFYSQERMGADGKLFELYKFRSMVQGAENKTGAVWATADDTRVTPFGAFLRRTSLDEIPQFYNVLRGDMSLVGPRPERPFFVEKFRNEIPKYMLRHRMKSGITGWAQVNGWRGNTSIEERIKYDLYYIRHWSHRFDLKILCMTAWKGFVNQHAY